MHIHWQRSSSDWCDVCVFTDLRLLSVLSLDEVTSLSISSFRSPNLSVKLQSHDTRLIMARLFFCRSLYTHSATVILKRERNQANRLTNNRSLFRYFALRAISRARRTSLSRISLCLGTGEQILKLHGKQWGIIWLFDRFPRGKSHKRWRWRDVNFARAPSLRQVGRQAEDSKWENNAARGT